MSCQVETSETSSVWIFERSPNSRLSLPTVWEPCFETALSSLAWWTPLLRSLPSTCSGFSGDSTISLRREHSLGRGSESHRHIFPPTPNRHSIFFFFSLHWNKCFSFRNNCKGKKKKKSKKQLWELIPLNSDLTAGVFQTSQKITVYIHFRAWDEESISRFTPGFNNGLKFKYFYCVDIKYCIQILNISFPDSAARNRAGRQARREARRVN